MPELTALELFAAVARYGSIGAAARHAGISQQAASARLRAMEAQVGAVLLDRDPRGSRLTPAGRQAVRAGPAVLSLLAVREAVAAGLLAVVSTGDLDLTRRLRAVWAGPAQPHGPARDLVAVAARLGAPPEPG